MELKMYDSERNMPSLGALRKILLVQAETPEEKFKVLDARDKLYKIMLDKDPNLSRGALIATCPDMCPEKERLLREYQGRGSIFEMTNFSKNSIFNHSLAVKEYARSSADQEEPLPYELRPIKVLTMTMSHLLHNVADFCELTDDNLEDWYMFMWDRTRALRKELTQQGVCSAESVILVEQCARFHIHCAERLIDQDSAIYDDKINTENLTKCLQTLKYMYKDLAKEDIKCPNAPEFICYTLLLNLNNSSVFTELSEMSDALMTSEPVKFALYVMSTWETRNYIRFFNLVKKTSYLNCCLLRRYFGEMRLYAIKTMIRSYCTKTYSPQIVISRLVENLNFEGEKECLSFLSECHFNFRKIGGRRVVNFDRVLFQNPKSTLTCGRGYLFIEEKKQQPFSVVMAGGTLPPKLIENYKTHSSFTKDGYLDADTFPNSDLFDITSSLQSNNKFEFKSDLVKSPTVDIFQKESTECIRDPRLFKKEKEGFSQPPLFSTQEPILPSENIFGSVKSFSSEKTSITTNIFGNLPNKGLVTTDNIFESSHGTSAFSKNIFGNQPSGSLFRSDNIFGSKTNTSAISFSSASEPSEKFSETSQPFPSSLLKNTAIFGGSFQFKPPLATNNENSKEETEIRFQEESKREERKIEKEGFEKTSIQEEQEEKKRKEEEAAKLLFEKKRMQEENFNKELERREREKREEEERKRKEEIARKELEERRIKEEKERQEKLKELKARQLEELKQQEENKRKIELEHKHKLDTHMAALKQKLQKWKTKIIFEKWRVKTWSKIEERKMNDYFKEVKLKYPPVCSEEELNGNPYGLVIPNVLTFEAFKNWNKDFNPEPLKKVLIVSQELPLLKLDSILGKSLEELGKNFSSTNAFVEFPWKLVISVPDEIESPDYWRSIETFVEMHFVDNFNWLFGVQKGPLHCRSGNRGTFRFKISVRRLRGCKLFEGSEPNCLATTGSNALIFLITEGGNDVSRDRLKAVVKSRAPKPKIPVIVFNLGSQLESGEVKKKLELEALQLSHVSSYHLINAIKGKNQIVAQLIKCLNLAVSHSGSPSLVKVNTVSSFFSGVLLDSLWRRIEISLSNFKVTLHEPKILIEFYNSCIEELTNIFLDESHNQETVLAEEFGECEAKRPNRTPQYIKNLTLFLDRLKLPHWPAETPKSSHQLNYRIHQYCKKLVGNDKLKMKNLKWLLYRIIRRALLWKGLDIYCDEDINEILINFPWIQVFQEITRVISRDAIEEDKKEKHLTVVYNLEKLNKFTFESSFIGKFFKKSKKQSQAKSLQSFGEEPEELSPCLEKDSIVYAYSVAIERESNKRKREECVNESLDALFSCPAEKRIVLDEEDETKNYDLSELDSSFQSLNERLDAIKEAMAENSKILLDIHNKMQ